MRIRFVWVGKTKDKSIAALTDEYLKRLGRFSPVDVTVVKEQKSNDEGNADRVIESDSKAIESVLNRDSYSVLLDIEGKGLTSPELSQFVRNRQDDGTKELV